MAESEETKPLTQERYEQMAEAAIVNLKALYEVSPAAADMVAYSLRLHPGQLPNNDPAHLIGLELIFSSLGLGEQHLTQKSCSLIESLFRSKDQSLCLTSYVVLSSIAKFATTDIEILSKFILEEMDFLTETFAANVQIYANSYILDIIVSRKRNISEARRELGLEKTLP